MIYNLTWLGVGICINIICCLISLGVFRRIAKTIYIPLWVIINLIFLIFHHNTIWDIVVDIIIVISMMVLFWLFYKMTKNKKFYYMKRIFTLSNIVHCLSKPTPSVNNLIIGNILPYNHFQLRYNGRYLIQDEAAARGGKLISGSMGSGKTFFMLSLIRQDIYNKKNVIFTDYKGDKQTFQSIYDYAEQCDYDIYTCVNGITNFNYDPLANLDMTGRIDTLLNMRQWSVDGSDDHYKSGVKALLQKTVHSYTQQYKKQSYNISWTIGFYQFITNYKFKREEFEAYETLVKLLSLLLNSSLHNCFYYQNNKEFSVVNKNGEKKKPFILLISFISSNKDIATSFSSLLFQDMLDSLTNAPYSHNLGLYIDEVGTLTNPLILEGLLAKCRSAYIAITIALQDLNQIIMKTNSAYLDSILGSLNAFIVFNGATRKTAEMFAGVQIQQDIEVLLMNLNKPVNGHPPTAMMISRQGIIDKNHTSELFRFIPFIFTGDKKNKKHNENGVYQYIQYIKQIFQSIHKRQQEKYLQEKTNVLEDTKDNISTNKDNIDDQSFHIYSDAEMTQQILHMLNMKDMPSNDESK